MKAVGWSVRWSCRNPWKVWAAAVFLLAAVTVTRLTGESFGSSTFVVVIVLALAAAIYRRELWALWRFRTALEYVDLKHHVRYVGWPRPVPSGMRLEVVIGRGREFDDLRKVEGELAAQVGCRRIACRRDLDHAGRGRVVLVDRDPFDPAERRPWPWVEARHVDLQGGIPFGIDELGETVMLDFFAQPHLLVGGNSGGGKSGALAQIVAGCALSDAHLYLLDGKLVEFNVWRHSCERFASEPEDARAILEDLVAVIETRQLELAASGLRKVDGHRPHVLVIDEIAEFVHDRALTETLKKVLRLGRACGVFVVSATQKPVSDSIPPTVRDLHGNRFCVRCANRFQAEAVLGGSASNEGDEPQREALNIPASCRGAGVLVDTRPAHTLLRTFWLSDDDIAAIAARTRRT